MNGQKLCLHYVVPRIYRGDYTNVLQPLALHSYKLQAINAAKGMSTSSEMEQLFFTVFKFAIAI